MSNKVTEAERDLIEELLGQYKPEAVAMLVGRSIRTVYYVAAELRSRGKKSYKLKPWYERLWNLVTKGDDYEEIQNTTGIWQNRRP